MWTGSFGAGLAITQGNKDTSNFNLSFDLKRDPKTRTVFKAEGLYILATEDGDENADRGIIAVRLERLITERAYVFGQVGYVRDRFKDIDYLVAPTAGIGYKVVATDRTTFDVDTSVGMVFEKNTGLDLETDGAVASARSSATSSRPTPRSRRDRPRSGRWTTSATRCIPSAPAWRPRSPRVSS